MIADVVESLCLADLWRMGEQWRGLLDAGQLAWRERWYSHNDDVVNGSGRQRGKSFWAYGLLDDCARSLPGTRVRYCALTIDTAQAILGGAMESYLAHCPTPMKPYQDGYDWVFPGGSRLIVMGTDATTFRRGRGFSRIALDVRDEFRFYQDFDAVEAALNPGLQVPGPSGKPGRCLRISTPNESPGHPSKRLVDSARARGRFELETLFQNPRVDPEQVIRKECDRLGMTRAELLASTYWRREYMGEEVTEESRAAVPSWPAVADECTREVERPTHFAGLVSTDWGGYTGDPHGALFGYCDFKAAKLVVEDEDEIRGGDIGSLAARWKAKEVARWGERAWDGTLWGAGYFEKHTKALPDYLKPAIIEAGPEGGTQPFLRVCDDDDNLQGEFLSRHGYALLPTDKNEKHLHVDDLVQGVRQKRVIIHPRCRRLLEQLRTVLWDEKRRQWVRTERDHGDLIDCFVAGTLVETQRGAVPVESVTTEDLAMTREGLRPVLISHKGRVARIWRMETEAGRVLEGTAEHPCWTQRGWVKLSQLTPCDTVSAWSQSLLSGAVAGGGEIPTASAAITASTTYTRATDGRSTCIAQCTWPKWGQSLLVSWFIISTAIRSTTRARTLRLFLRPTTRPATWIRVVARWLPRLLGRQWLVPTSAQPSPSGAGLMPGCAGIPSMRAMCGPDSRTKTVSAKSAASTSKAETPRAPAGAALPVRPRLGGARESMTSGGLVSGAEESSVATSTHPSGFVADRVRRVTQTPDVRPVYNLAVAGAHEYVANGILVHNCLVYMWRNVPWHFDPFPPPPPDYWLHPKENDMEALAKAMTGRRR